MENELIVKQINLPSTIGELQRFVLIAKEKLKIYKSQLDAVDRLELSRDIRQQKLEETQDIATALLWAESKMGELLKPLANPTASRRGMRQLPEGITHKQSHYCQTLAENQDLIAETIQESIENEDIPTRTEVLRKVQEQKREERFKDIQSKELPQGIFNVIYLDPPWQYKNSGFNTSAEKQYPTLSMEQLKELPIPNLAYQDAIMFMWATNPLLKDAIELIEHWGFNYKTNFVWIKNHHTSGFYVYGQHELLLIGVKGSMLPIGEIPSSIIKGNNMIHSKKPEIVYEIIEKMYPKLKYVELFARTGREGWLSWGLEYGK